MRTFLALVLTLVALTGAALAKPPVDCVALTSVPSAPAALIPEAACTVATHPLTATILPDLSFAPPLCYVTTFTGKLTIDGRSTAGFTIVAYSGVSTNTTGAALEPIPPLMDGTGAPRPLISFAAATIIEVRSESRGTVVGQLVSRDTGWGELDLTTAMPKFATERLVVTHATGRLFDGARGEIFFSGDQFGGGGFAKGTLCGPRLKRRVEKTFP
ncbi:MAG TPA: hypothetical protein VGR62_24655 [Candidatus Binatia bacterium]|jgi:hypothetical protein|nr:hypothetical protein [Candidatus Binatia bacterium]